MTKDVTKLKTEPTPLDNPGNWITDNDYPVSALVDGVEGMTAFSLTVGVDGRVSDCQVTTGSGSEALDETTCLVLRQRARFNPALDGKNRPTEGIYKNRIHWRIPANHPKTVTDYPKRLHWALEVDEEGRVESCKVLENTGNATFVERLNRSVDPCDAAKRSQQLIPVLDAEGNPIKARLEMKTEAHITPR